MGNHLSFTTPKGELLRQMFIEAAGYSLDPRGKADAIMTVIITSVYTLGLLAVVYMLWNRNYPPLKSKNPIIMALTMVASILWFVGDLQSNGHLQLATSSMTNCKGFGVWMRILLGVCLLASLIALRAYGLYRVFCRNLPYHSFGLYLPFGLYLLCLVIYGAVSQALSPSITTQYLLLLDICNSHPSFKAALFSFMWVSLFVVIFIHWKIRNIKSSFNETREMTVTCAIVLLLLVFETVMNYVSPQYPLNVRLRIATTSLDHFATNVMWWLIMGVPLYNCMFNRQRYLNNWVFKLRMDGLQNEYDVDSDAAVAKKQGMPNSYNMRGTMKLASTTGNKEVGFYYARDNGNYNGNASVSIQNAQNAFSQNFEDPLYTNAGIYYSLDSHLPGVAGHRQDNIIMEIIPESPQNHSTSPKLRPLSQNVGKWEGSANSSDRYIVPLGESQLYTPISFPDAVMTAPFKPGAAQNGHLDHYDSHDRQLI
ncbi:hypothetical protein BX661DRAFT_63644 [Kickxella alabastrina]|uniref:uncharacterized protein n=1 Tax=Kickxella alabastrina TaxID=61397 RepID=UPI00221E41E8|nr:uncharacterized protein BX661DRAFT_63644 [Kickxella alabastrina]KAI7833644.1 hypothetical protein BX661DRAFT_63644 [Kickxella alabastrina]